MKSIIDMHNERWTTEQVVTEALDRLEAQGTRSVREDTDSCMYYVATDTGCLMCAVGLMLPNPEDFSELEADVYDLIENHCPSRALEDALDHYREALNFLQTFHDRTRADHEYYYRYNDQCLQFLAKHSNRSKADLLKLHEVITS